MAEDYPTAAYWLLLIGGILEIIGWIPLGILWGASFLAYGYYAFYAFVCMAVIIVWFLIWAILMIVAAVWVKTGDPAKVHKGAVLGLIAAILGGINIFALIGAILAFSWKKKAPMVIPPPPPPSM